MRYNRRNLIKTLGAASVTASLAGCSGNGSGNEDSNGNGDGNGGGTATSQPTDDDGAPSPDQFDSEDQYATAWREFASERAAEELADGGPVTYASTFISDPFDARFISNEFEGVYEPLTGNIEAAAAAGDDHRSRYSRFVASDNAGYDLLDFFMDRMVADGVPVGDVSSVPGFREAPDDVTTGNWRGGRMVWARTVQYNTERVDPPETWEDVLNVPGEEWIVDFTPDAVGLGAVYEKQGREFFDRLAEKEGISTVTSGLTIGERVANGQAGITIITPSTNRWNFPDGNLEIAPGNDLHSFVTRPLQLSTLSEVPWAAKLAYDYLMNDDHDDVQAPRGGTMALDLESAEPQSFADYYDGKIWTANDLSMSFSEYYDIWQSAVGSPTS
jgi:ABC-type Fe3+ transport system substrate-binding protein